MSVPDDWDWEDLDAGTYLGAGSRGITHGYARSTSACSRALVVGCNYPHAGPDIRLYGASTDAREWRNALSDRLGIPKSCIALLVDEDEDGAPVDPDDIFYPSQKNLQSRLQWLTQDAAPGDLMVFVFCGHGSLAPDFKASELAIEESDPIDEERAVEQGFLCADFDYSDWLNGYSMRMLTSESLHRHWAYLPKGSSLALVIDADHGTSILPVSRRLDSEHLPEMPFGAPPAVVTEPLCSGCECTVADMKHRLREGLQAGKPGSNPLRKARDAALQLPERHIFRPAAVSLFQDDFEMDEEVQAFAFVASGPRGLAYEASCGYGDAATLQKRGVLSFCLLQALEAMNFQGSYYELWWKAVEILRQQGLVTQHFQLTWSDGTDPTNREAFAPVGDAEVQAYLKRIEMDDKSGAGEFNGSAPQCFMFCDDDAKVLRVEAGQAKCAPKCGCSEKSCVVM